MDEKFTPPPPIDSETAEQLLECAKDLTGVDLQIFNYKLRHDPRLAKYRDKLKVLKKQEKAAKRHRLREWWWSKGIQITNLILSLIAAITGVIALLR